MGLGDQLVTRDPRHGLGGPYTSKKVLRDLGVNPHTAAAICKEVLTPTPPKKGIPGYGGLRGSKSKNSFGDHFLS